MKTKVRSLSVDGVSYVWRVKRLDPQHVLLRVWPAQNARQCQELHACIRFDDPWLNYGPLLTAPPERIAEVFVLDPITPSRVRDVILAALRAGWQPNLSGRSLPFEWSPDGLSSLC